MTQVKSKDGTLIAYHKAGTGPAIILVDGAFCSKDFGPMPKLAPLLSQHFTVITYDRRARGESGDTKPYAIDREIEDIEALITNHGGRAHLFGVSSGAILALHAVAKGLNVPKLAIFEPPFAGKAQQARRPHAVRELTGLIDHNELGKAVKFYLRKVMGVPAIFTFLIRMSQNWSKMTANARSLPYDATICGDFEIPKGIADSISIPVLAIDSIKSPKILRTAVESVVNALPNATRKSLNGTLHDVPAKILVPELAQFFR